MGTTDILAVGTGMAWFEADPGQAGRRVLLVVLHHYFNRATLPGTGVHVLVIRIIMVASL